MSSSMRGTPRRLCGGPQDGEWVDVYNKRVIYVAALGDYKLDNLTAWQSRRVKFRFPHRYVRKGTHYIWEP